MARILIADNSDPVRCTLAALLQSQGYEVDQAADGLQVLDYFSDSPSDAVLMDVYMPRMDGLEACRQLRKASRVPILMLSSYGHSQLKEQALSCGADGFVSKPLEFDDVLAWVRAISEREAKDSSDSPIDPV
jgi:two-component system response regulator VicR